jgi:hypothetical protein
LKVEESTQLHGNRFFWAALRMHAEDQSKYVTHISISYTRSERRLHSMAPLIPRAAGPVLLYGTF